MRRALVAAGAAGITLLAAACGSSGGGGTASGGPGSSGPVTLRLGYLQNITHASALVAIKEGFLAKNLGKNVTLKLTPFSTGTEEGTALLAGQLDAAYVGPNPAFQTSGGKLIKVISGAASGGASLVVKKGITSASQLKGQKLATPSLGNTQDVALRYWLKQHNLSTDQAGGGDVPLTPVTPNSAAVDEFASGQIAGGWEPEPYASEMVAAGGHVLVDEASLWPGGKFVTTQLVALSSYMKDHPDVINGLLKAQIQATGFLNNSKSEAQQAANDQLATLTGKSLKPDILAETFKAITFTDDPIASSLLTDAKHATAVGLLDPISDLGTIFDLDPLNKLLSAAGEQTVSSS
jgi:NitT/TauT family transport system substrate-binding protein